MKNLEVLRMEDFQGEIVYVWGRDNMTIVLYLVLDFCFDFSNLTFILVISFIYYIIKLNDY